jgi:hypothetical protein
VWKPAVPVVSQILRRNVEQMRAAVRAQRGRQLYLHGETICKIGGAFATRPALRLIHEYYFHCTAHKSRREALRRCRILRTTVNKSGLNDYEQTILTLGMIQSDFGDEWFIADLPGQIDMWKERAKTQP